MNDNLRKRNLAVLFFLIFICVLLYGVGFVRVGGRLG